MRCPRGTQRSQPSELRVQGAYQLHLVPLVPLPHEPLLGPGQHCWRECRPEGARSGIRRVWMTRKTPRLEKLSCVSHFSELINPRSYVSTRMSMDVVHMRHPELQTVLGLSKMLAPHSAVI